MTILPKEGPMYCVEKYMTDHQFLEADKKKARDYLRIQRYDRAYLTRSEADTCPHSEDRISGSGGGGYDRRCLRAVPFSQAAGICGNPADLDDLGSLAANRGGAFRQREGGEPR